MCTVEARPRGFVGRRASPAPLPPRSTGSHSIGDFFVSKRVVAAQYPPHLCDLVGLFDHLGHGRSDQGRVGRETVEQREARDCGTGKCMGSPVELSIGRTIEKTTIVESDTGLVQSRCGSGR